MSVLLEYEDGRVVTEDIFANMTIDEKLDFLHDLNLKVAKLVDKIKKSADSK